MWVIYLWTNTHTQTHTTTSIVIMFHQADQTNPNDLYSLFLFPIKPQQQPHCCFRFQCYVYQVFFFQNCVEYGCVHVEPVSWLDDDLPIEWQLEVLHISTTRRPIGTWYWLDFGKKGAKKRDTNAVSKFGSCFRSNNTLVILSRALVYFPFCESCVAVAKLERVAYMHTHTRMPFPFMNWFN